jgi:hypothetical protein
MAHTFNRAAGPGGAWAAVLLTFCALSGCGDDGLEKRYPVSGKVTFNGTPLRTGNIDFVPDDATQGRAASGKITDGQYQLGTIADSDGAFPGSYKVRIKSVDVDYSAVVKNTPKGAAGRQDDVIKATRAAKKLIPPRYELETTSNLTAKVEAKSNTIDFPLSE